MSSQDSSTLQAKLARWSKRLASLPSLALPTDYPRPSPPRVVESLQHQALNPSHKSQLAQLQSQFSELHPTEFQLALTAFILLLHRYTPDPSLLICSSTPDPASPSTSIPLLLLINISPEETFGSLLKQVLAVEAEAKEDAVPLELLEKEIKRSQPERGDGPLFRVRFLDGTHQAAHDGAENGVGKEGMGLETDLTMVFGRGADGGQLEAFFFLASVGPRTGEEFLAMVERHQVSCLGLGWRVVLNPREVDQWAKVKRSRDGICRMGEDTQTTTSAGVGQPKKDGQIGFARSTRRQLRPCRLAGWSNPCPCSLDINSSPLLQSLTGSHG